MTNEPKSFDRRMHDALARTPDCLSPAELENLADNPAAGNAHLESCPRCQAELSMLADFRSTEPVLGEGAAVAWISSQLERNLPQIRSSSKSASARSAHFSMARFFGAVLFRKGDLRWVTAAAAAVILCATALLWLRSSREPELRADAGAGPALYRSTEVQLLSPVGSVTHLPSRLEWKPVQGAASYKVTIEEVDHSVIEEMTTSDVAVTIPAAAGRTLTPGKPLVWRVTALDVQGRVLATSQNARFWLQSATER